jgi:hypothetical protein
LAQFDLRFVTGDIIEQKLIGGFADLFKGF